MTARTLTSIILFSLGTACTSEAGPPLEPSSTRASSLSPVIDTVQVNLVIGTETGLAEEAFGRVVDIEAAPDGSIYVLDQQAASVRVFDGEGRFVRSIGREGDGPGEFRRPGRLAIGPEGSAWVFDSALRSVLVIDPNGRERDRHETTSSGPSGGPLSSLWDGVVRADGSLVQSVQRADPVPGLGLIETRNRTYIRTLVPESGQVDSTLVADDPLRRYRYRGEGPGGGMGTFNGIVSFDPRRLVALGPEAEVWTALSTEYALTRISTEGDTVRVEVSGGDNVAGPDERATWERLSENVPGLEPPTSRHILARLLVDSDGRLWVQRAEGSTHSSRFDVFSTDGAPLGSVFIPRRLGRNSAIVRHGHVYAVIYDELGLARVVRAPVPDFDRRDR